MRYSLKGNLVPLSNNQEIEDGAKIVEVVTKKEYMEKFSGHLHQRLLIHTNSVQYCKADLLKECVVGSFVIPDKKNVLRSEVEFDFYMTQEEFLFIDDTGRAAEVLEELLKVEIFDKTYIAHFLFEFMEYLIKDDVPFLETYENYLAELEENILKGDVEDVNQKMLVVRKELLTLEKYYRQLADMSESFESNKNRMFSEEDCRVFALYENRVSRLYDNVQTLKEYTMQLREMYQSQIDIRQNKIMQFLTVVTTIFMPLTLITGWYGMNFVNMPELKMETGYFIIIGISVVVLIAEVIFFKIKKWFD